MRPFAAHLAWLTQLKVGLKGIRDRFALLPSILQCQLIGFVAYGLKFYQPCKETKHLSVQNLDFHSWKATPSPSLSSLCFAPHSHSVPPPPLATWHEHFWAAEHLDRWLGEWVLQLQGAAAAAVATVSDLSLRIRTPLLWGNEPQVKSLIWDCCTESMLETEDDILPWMRTLNISIQLLTIQLWVKVY